MDFCLDQTPGFVILTQTQFEMMTLATTETSMMMIIIIQRGLCDRVRRVLPSPCMPVQQAQPPPPCHRRRRQQPVGIWKSYDCSCVLIWPSCVPRRITQMTGFYHRKSNCHNGLAWNVKEQCTKTQILYSVFPINIWKNTTKSSTAMTAKSAKKQRCTRFIWVFIVHTLDLHITLTMTSESTLTHCEPVCPFSYLGGGIKFFGLVFVIRSLFCTFNLTGWL